MLFLALTTLLALQDASSSPAVGGTGSSASDGAASQSRGADATPTPAPPRSGTPRTRPSPTPTPKASGDVLVVVNKSDGTVSVLDAATGKSRGTIPVEKNSHEAELLADGKTLAVSGYGRSGEPGRYVTLVDLTTGKVASRLDIGEGSRPHGLKALPDGRLLVTAEGKRELVVADPRSGKMSRIATGKEVSHMVTASPDGRRAYVSSLAKGAVTVIDLVAGKVLQDVATGKGAEGLDVTPDGREIWVANPGSNTISVIEAKTLQVVFTIKAGEFPIRVKITPDGTRALVSFTGSGDIGVFDVATRTESKRIAIGRDAVSRTEDRTFARRFGKSPAPVGLFVAPNGKRAWVAAAHADVIAVIDLEKLRIEDAWTAGREPDGLAGRFGKK